MPLAVASVDRIASGERQVMRAAVGDACFFLEGAMRQAMADAPSFPTDPQGAGWAVQTVCCDCGMNNVLCAVRRCGQAPVLREVESGLLRRFSKELAVRTVTVGLVRKAFAFKKAGRFFNVDRRVCWSLSCTLLPLVPRHNALVAGILHRQLLAYFFPPSGQPQDHPSSGQPPAESSEGTPSMPRPEEGFSGAAPGSVKGTGGLGPPLKRRSVRDAAESSKGTPSVPRSEEGFSGA
ncbi:hypothetical protein DIPPA_63124, partial [Diplonema papillatum]